MNEFALPDPRKPPSKVRHPNGQLDTTFVSPGVRSLVHELCGQAGLAVCAYYLWDAKGNAEEKGVPVQITGGKYWGSFGISNFWDWNEVDIDCEHIPGSRHSGYDNINGQFHGPISIEDVRKYWEENPSKDKK